jgi:hypothetical protein
MSLTSLPTLANVGIRSASDLLHGRTLPSMARAVGVVLGAGILAASYQLAYEEGRTIIHNVRVASAHRRQRNEAILLALLSTTVPVEMQDRLRRSRDVVSTAFAWMTRADFPIEHRTVLRDTLSKVLTPPEISPE